MNSTSAEGKRPHASVHRRQGVGGESRSWAYTVQTRNLQESQTAPCVTPESAVNTAARVR